MAEGQGNEQQAGGLEELIRQRRRKLDALRSLGQDPFANDFRVEHTLAELRAACEGKEPGSDPDEGDAALAVALDYCRAIRKTPIVVNDSRGFYTSRVVGTYIREGHMMLMEGVPAAMIENLGRMAGMPVGPLSLNDEVAVDEAVTGDDMGHPQQQGDV